ncbi:Nucleosome assembly protein [Nakaseomyces bracarensis]|uniref:Nucleosome assembly protein n=1 Tax=Nakaseomyces bracarensis TaxID=273131 RepID=A0ABR4NMD4_9SACH
MSAPIKTNKPKSSMKIDNAPTPHNTPSSVLAGSYLKNGNPVTKDKLPPTISEEDIQTALSGSQPLLLESIQQKLGTLVGQDSGYIDSLPQVVKNRIFALKKLQSDLFSLEKDFQVEMFELEHKYLQKYAPLHSRRSEIISGKEEPNEEEVSKGKEIQEKEEGQDFSEEQGEKPSDIKLTAEDIKGIPSFWLTALENLPIVSDTITDRDAEVLEFLEDVTLEYLTEGKPGFLLHFKFSEENPYFKNKVLTKTYYYQSELGYSGDFIYDHADGCEIEWTDNESNATIAVEMRKQRNKTTKQVRTIEKITPIESFFNFFDPPKMNPNEVSEEDEEEYEDLEERLALDYSIGEQIKDKLIPRAVDWFTGAALEFEFNEAEGDEEFGEFDEEDDEDDEEEDDEDEDDFAGKKEEPPECKQS